MAIEDAVLKLGGADVLFKETGALLECPHHPEIVIRVGDHEKERRAFELADNRLRHLPDDEREAAKESMAASLKTAADRLCPLCSAKVRNS
jgi:hypothetical protein